MKGTPILICTKNLNVSGAETIGHEDDLALKSDDYPANLADDDSELEASELTEKKSCPTSVRNRKSKRILLPPPGNPGKLLRLRAFKQTFVLWYGYNGGSKFGCGTIVTLLHGG